jgi:hypothetical protein
MNILHLTLKKQWFDMIASGIKTEEYREMKPYWHKFLAQGKYDVIRFRNGYNTFAPAMIVELKEILTGLGIVEWGAPEATPVYILRLGKIISINNYQTSRCQCDACSTSHAADGTVHLSNCAVHNAPAYPAGQCDCGRIAL